MSLCRFRLRGRRVLVPLSRLPCILVPFCEGKLECATLIKEYRFLIDFHYFGIASYDIVGYVGCAGISA
jgi:hypothetical protein